MSGKSLFAVQSRRALRHPGRGLFRVPVGRYFGGFSVDVR